MNNSHVEKLLPEEWRPYFIENTQSTRAHYSFCKPSASVIYGPDGRPAQTTDMQIVSATDVDIDGTDEHGIHFLDLASAGSPDIWTKVKGDIDTVLWIFRNIKTTWRFNTSDSKKFRSANARETDLAVMYIDHQHSIKGLEALLEKHKLKLSDPIHLLMACRIPQVQRAIDKRFKQLWVSEVAIGSRLEEEEAMKHKHETTGNIMPIMQLIYNTKRVVSLDLTHPNPDGPGYKMWESLWVVEKK